MGEAARHPTDADDTGSNALDRAHYGKHDGGSLESPDAELKRYARAEVRLRWGAIASSLVGVRGACFIRNAFCPPGLDAMPIVMEAES